MFVLDNRSQISVMDWQAFIALGSNIGDRAEILRHAIHQLDTTDHTKVVRCSSVYENAAMLAPGDAEPQPDFLNAVTELRTSLSPFTLLERLLQIELLAGRLRSDAKWEARPLDLDLLIYNSLTLHLDRLTLPHPGIPYRRFVLEPLVEIAPELIIPEPVNLGVKELLEGCTDTSPMVATNLKLC